MPAKIGRKKRADKSGSGRVRRAGRLDQVADVHRGQPLGHEGESARMQSHMSLELPPATAAPTRPASYASLTASTTPNSRRARSPAAAVVAGALVGAVRGTGRAGSRWRVHLDAVEAGCPRVAGGNAEFLTMAAISTFSIAAAECPSGLAR
jgi:hypothetical protein